MQDIKNKNNIAIILFIVIALLSFTSVVEAYISIVIDSENYYDYVRLGLNPWKNCVYRWEIEGFVRFLAYLITNVIFIAPVLGGLIGSSKNKKTISMISVIILDVLCVLTIFSRLTGVGVHYLRAQYDGIKLSADMPIIFICTIILNVLILGSKEAVQNTVVQAATSATNQPSIRNTTNVDAIEEIKKLKSLLDMEVITKEEFEAKKKQLL